MIPATPAQTSGSANYPDVILPPLVLPPEPAPIKPGWQSSEGVLTIISLVTALAGQLSGALPEPYPAIIVAVITCLYTIARTMLKIRALQALPTPTP